MRRFLTIAFVLMLLGSCSKEKDVAVSFYYWKTTFQLSAKEREVLTLNKVAKLYVRYFDVVLKNGKAIPLSPISFEEPSIDWEIVPVVYIKNEVMRMPNAPIDDLADKVIGYVEQINGKHSIEVKEIQLDCDWTLKSKDTYLRFVELVKSKWGKKLSATIRLHQVKYFQGTGVPKVDYGVLMYYNMGRIASDSLNSIYDRKTAQRYLASLSSYPLPLEVALPIFSWSVHIRHNKVIALLSKVDGSVFADDPNFSKKDDLYVEAIANVVKLGHYFEKGDRIKTEMILPKDVEEMAGDLKFRDVPNEIIFYDLDDFSLKNYEDDKQFFQKVAGHF